MATEKVQQLIDEAMELEDNSLDSLVEALEELGDEANGNSSEYRVLKEAIDLIKNPPKEDDCIEVTLKCNHPKGKVDEKVCLPKEEAEKLIGKAFAIKA